MAATGKESVSLSQLKTVFDKMNGNIASAVAAEASAREKQDGLIQDAVDSKLQPSDLVAGDNVEIDAASQPGRVVISATVGDAIALATDAEAKGFLGY